MSQIKPAIEGGVISAGNASQFSDGASAAVVMSDREAAKTYRDRAAKIKQNLHKKLWDPKREFFLHLSKRG